MKKNIIITFVSSLIALSLISGVSAAGGLTKESCTTGKYNSYYGASCDTCGYFNDGIHRLYKDKPKDYWDYYINTTKKETIFSNKSITDIIDYGNFLNDESLTGLNIRSSWVPANIGDDDAIIFRIKNLTFNSLSGALRDNPVGMIEYNLRAVPLDVDGDKTSGAFDHYYTHGIETKGANGIWNLNMNNEVSSGIKQATYYESALYEHKECYAVLPAWCGDGVIDSVYGETCDPADTNKVGWGTNGCSNSCQPVNGGGGGGGGGGGSYCGDGKVQRPNSRGTQEECDFGSESDWGFCSKTTCQITGLGGGSGNEGQLSVPNDGKIIFGPTDYVTVGDGMNPFVSYSSDIPYIFNKSDYEFFFDGLCVAKHSGDSVAGTSNQCRSINKIIKPGEIVRYSDLPPYTNYPNFVGYSDGIASGDKVGENKLVTTVKQGSTVYTNAYFAGPYRVRTAKPTISTTGGGTSFVKNTSNISNVNKIAQDADKAKNKNFVGAGVSAGDISSYSKDVTETDKVNKVVKEGQDYNKSANRDADFTSHVSGTTDDINEFSSYNGITNAFILKNKNFEINSNIFSSKSGARTYIIENANLIINSNISYGENIAFVVKGGDIKISKNVTSLDGIYISIPNGSVGGEFEGIGGKTFDILNFNGSIYGNIEKLVSQRTYIKDNPATGLIDVGTVVSFGSSVFREPAPLTTTFINEFIESTKIAQ